MSCCFCASDSPCSTFCAAGSPAYEHAGANCLDWSPKREGTTVQGVMPDGSLMEVSPQELYEVWKAESRRVRKKKEGFLKEETVRIRFLLKFCQEIQNDLAERRLWDEHEIYSDKATALREVLNAVFKERISLLGT